MRKNKRIKFREWTVKGERFRLGSNGAFEQWYGDKWVNRGYSPHKAECAAYVDGVSDHLPKDVNDTIVLYAVYGG